MRPRRPEGLELPGTRRMPRLSKRRDTIAVASKKGRSRSLNRVLFLLSGTTFTFEVSSRCSFCILV